MEVFLVMTTKMMRSLSNKAILNDVLKVFDAQSWTPRDSGLFFTSHNFLFFFNVTGNVNLYYSYINLLLTQNHGVN